MTYVTTLYSKKCDKFEIDCIDQIWTPSYLADYIVPVVNYYNNQNNVDDFQIISIVKMEG